MESNGSNKEEIRTQNKHPDPLKGPKKHLESPEFEEKVSLNKINMTLVNPLTRSKAPFNLLKSPTETP